MYYYYYSYRCYYCSRPVVRSPLSSGVLLQQAICCRNHVCETESGSVSRGIHAFLDYLIVLRYKGRGQMWARSIGPGAVSIQLPDCCVRHRFGWRKGLPLGRGMLRMGSPAARVEHTAQSLDSIYSIESDHWQTVLVTLLTAFSGIIRARHGLKIFS